MTRSKIDAAIAAANKFNSFATKVIEEMTRENARGYITVGTKLTGALRRASLDLTRALAEMRKSS